MIMIIPSQKPIFDNKKITLELRARVDFPINKLEKLIVEQERYNLSEAEALAVLWGCIKKTPEQIQFDITSSLFNIKNYKNTS